MKTLNFKLRGICALIAGVLFFSNTRAQYVTIPDTNFVHYLQTYFPSCMSGNQLDTTCPAVLSANNLNLNNAQLTNATGIQYFKNVTDLDVSNNALVTLPALPPTLTDFHCGQNQLTSLPALPDGIQFFNCASNNLTSLPAPLPSALLQISASMNSLTSIPAIPPLVSYLIVSNNQLTSLPALASPITYFDCSHNQIAALPALSTLGGQIICDYNMLTSIPALSDSVTYLSCTYNRLTVLPALPGSLQSLYCSNNNLDSLPTLDAALQNLYCYQDSLSFLPALNYGLQQFNCAENRISYIASFPSTLTVIEVDFNPFTSLPPLPPVLNTLSCSGDTNMYCLPELTSIQMLQFDGTPIACLPNYINENPPNQSFPPLNSLPLCGDYNPNSCPVDWNITGRAYVDSGMNCTFGGTDIGEQNIKVQLWNAGVLQQQVFTIGGGLYSMLTGDGIFNVTVDTSVLPFYVDCAPGNTRTDTISATDTLSYNNDFAFNCKPGFDIAAWSIYSHHFVPGHVDPVSCTAGDMSQFYGVHCASGVSGYVVLQISGPAQFLSPDSSALPPSYASSDSIVWNVADYGAVNFYEDFAAILQTDTNAALGQTVCLTLTAYPITGDNNPSNNTITNCYTVVSSYDPNEKLVSPVGNINPGQQWLTYTIQFQNTGTAPAGTIVITDTLSSQLDASTFQLLAYSTPPGVKIDNGVVYFTFKGINLPDSSTSAQGSMGYVQYKIKLNNNLPLGTTINNTAYVYFDYNAPVVTNTTTSTIAVASGINTLSSQASGLSFKLFPNPANEYVNLSADESAIGGLIEVTDLTGRTLIEEHVAGTTTTIFTKGMAAGVYFVKLTSPGGISATGKVVIQ